MSKNESHNPIPNESYNLTQKELKMDKEETIPFSNVSEDLHELIWVRYT